MTVISKALNFIITADSGSFSQAMRSASNELRTAQREMMAALPPAERLQSRINSLEAALREGKVTQERYNEAVQKLRDIDAQTQAIRKQTEALERMKKTRGEIISQKLEKLPIVGHLAGDVGKAVDMAGGALGPIAAVGSVVAVGRHAIKSFMEEAEKIDIVGKSAERLGIGAESMLIFGKAAKLADVDVNEFSSALLKMEKNIGKAIIEGGTAEAPFKELGLSVDDLRQMEPDQAFLAISDALRGLKDPYEAASLGAEIFGKSAGSLNEVLKVGSERFLALRESMGEKGQLFSAEEARRVEEAAKAMKRLGESAATVRQRGTIMAAPGVEFGAEFMGQGMNGMGLLPGRMGVVQGAIGAVESIIRRRLDEADEAARNAAKGGQAKYLKAAEQERAAAEKERLNAEKEAILVGAAAAKEDESRLKALDDLGVAFDKYVVSQTAATLGLSKWQTQVREMDADPRLDGSLKAAAQMFADMRDVIDDIARERKETESLVDSKWGIIKALYAERDAINQTAEARQLAKLKEMGADDDQLDEAKRIQDGIKEAKRQQSLLDEGKRMNLANRTPEQKLADDLAKLNEQLAMGAIEWQAYEAEVRKAKEAIEKPIKQQFGAEASRAGTMEAQMRQEEFRANFNWQPPANLPPIVSQPAPLPAHWQQAVHNFLGEIARNTAKAADKEPLAVTEMDE